MTEPERINPEKMIFVISPSYREAEDWLQADMGIHPKHPNIRISTNARILYGLKPGLIVIIHDPRGIGEAEFKAEVKYLMLHREFRTEIPADLLAAIRAGEVVK